MTGNCHVRCGAGEKPEVFAPEAYLSLFALPDDFCSLLSTMRSREISCIIIIQNLAQIKALFKDTWETIPGNCDSLIYLGGNEQSTHKYLSEGLGKGTIDKRSSGETKGRNGSSSRNFDVLGRELLTVDETRKLDNSQCIVMIRGCDPILDRKYNTFAHPVFKESGDGDGDIYVHQMGEPDSKVRLLGEKSLAYYAKKKQEGEPVEILEVSMDEIFRLNPIPERIYTEEEIGENRAEGSGSGKEVRPQNIIKKETKAHVGKQAPDDEQRLMEMLRSHAYSEFQLEEIHAGVAGGLSYHQILGFANVAYSTEKMRQLRLQCVKEKD